MEGGQLIWERQWIHESRSELIKRNPSQIGESITDKGMGYPTNRDRIVTFAEEKQAAIFWNFQEAYL